MTRLLLTAIVAANNKAKRLAIRLTKWTGKSPAYVHPKHLLGEDPEQYWYLAYVRPTDRVLDLGCGHGAHALRVASKARTVTGLDRDLDALYTARHSVNVAIDSGNRRAASAFFFMSDLEQSLTLPSHTYDLVLCLDVLEHLVNRQQLLAEIRRVLAPNGRLLLVVPNRATSWKRRLARAGCFAYSDPDHKVEYTLDELRVELATGGFTIRALHPAVYDTPLIGLIDLVGGCSLTLYRRITAYRRRLAARYPDEAAGFYAVCEVAR